MMSLSSAVAWLRLFKCKRDAEIQRCWTTGKSLALGIEHVCARARHLSHFTHTCPSHHEKLHGEQSCQPVVIMNSLIILPEGDHLLQSTCLLQLPLFFSITAAGPRCALQVMLAASFVSLPPEPPHLVRVEDKCSTGTCSEGAATSPWEFSCCQSCFSTYKLHLHSMEIDLSVGSCIACYGIACRNCLG